MEPNKLQIVALKKVLCTYLQTDTITRILNTETCRRESERFLESVSSMCIPQAIQTCLEQFVASSPIEVASPFTCYVCFPRLMFCSSVHHVQFTPSRFFCSILSVWYFEDENQVSTITPKLAITIKYCVCVCVCGGGGGGGQPQKAGLGVAGWRYLPQKKH